MYNEHDVICVGKERTGSALNTLFSNYSFVLTEDLDKPNPNELVSGEVAKLVRNAINEQPEGVLGWSMSIISGKARFSGEEVDFKINIFERNITKVKLSSDKHLSIMFKCYLELCNVGGI